MTTWVSNGYLYLNNIGFDDEDLSEYVAIHNIPVSLNAAVQWQMKNNEVNRFITQYFRNAFSQQISDSNKLQYKLTIAIAKWFYALEVRNRVDNSIPMEFHGLHYPTVRMNSNADNYVLKKSVIDRNMLSIERVEYIEVLDFKNDTYKYKLIDLADTLKNGEIQWKNLTRTWTLFDASEDLYFAETDGSIDAYDNLGELIAPD